MVTTERLSLQATPRTAMGKKNRALRRNGITPLHVYGLTAEPLALQADTLTVWLVLREAGYTTPVTIKVDGGEEAVTLVRGITKHPVSGDLIHVDFMRVDVDIAVEVDVPITLVNTEAAPVTNLGEISVTQGVYEITVSARPYDVPNEIEVDCIALETLDDVIRAGDLKLPANVELATDPEQAIAWGEEARVTSEEDLVPAEEAEEEAEGEEGEEPEAAEGSAEEGGEGETSEEEE